MKHPCAKILATLAMACAVAHGAGVEFTNFIRQTQVPSGVQWDVSVAPIGEQISPLAVDTDGAKFELWSVKSSPLTSYLLDSRYVGTYVPSSTIVIRTEDPYAQVPRTRADRPFQVDITTAGLLADPAAPDAARSVKLLRHVQSYGVGGTGETIDRSQATLLSQASITQNGTITLNYTLTSAPGADRSKVRGEERFSVYSLADQQVPETQLVSKHVQIWPVADGALAGVNENQMLRFQVPQLTLTLNDLYPSSTTYLQIYKGEARLGQTGTTVPGSVLVINETAPQDRVLVLKDYGAMFDADGRWTLEVVTATPFGLDRLAHVTVTVNRSINLNGTFTTSE